MSDVSILRTPENRMFFSEFLKEQMARKKMDIYSLVMRAAKSERTVRNYLNGHVPEKVAISTYNEFLGALDCPHEDFVRFLKDKGAQIEPTGKTDNHTNSESQVQDNSQSVKTVNYNGTVNIEAQVETVHGGITFNKSK